MVLGGHEFMVECEELGVEAESFAPLPPPSPLPLPAFAPTAAAAAAATARLRAAAPAAPESGGPAGRAAVLAEIAHVEDMLLARIEYLKGVRASSS